MIIKKRKKKKKKREIERERGGGGICVCGGGGGEEGVCTVVDSHTNYDVEEKKNTACLTSN